jgi:hypothetical protein
MLTAGPTSLKWDEIRRAAMLDTQIHTGML